LRRANGRFANCSPRCDLHLGIAFCDLVLQAVLVGAEFLAQFWIGGAEDLDSEQGGVDRARAAERHGGYRDAGRHLERGVERIKAVERTAGDRNADHREDRVGGEHAAEVGGTAGRRDDDLEAARFGVGRVIRGEFRCAVCGDDAHVKCDAEGLQHGGGLLHERPV